MMKQKIQLGEKFTEKLFVDELERCWKLFRDERYYDQAIQVKQFVGSFYKKKNNYSELSQHYKQLSELYKEKQEKGEHERKMYYYFVKFIGKKWKENDGVSFVYRSFDILKQQMELLKHQFEPITNEEVKIIGMNGQKRESTEHELVIEIISLTQQTSAIRNNQFFCELPVKDKSFCNGTSNKIEKWGKNVFTFTTKYPLPSQLIRQKVVKITVTYVNPIETAIESMKIMIVNVNQLIEQSKTTMNTTAFMLKLESYLKGILQANVSGGIQQYSNMMKNERIAFGMRKKLNEQMKILLERCERGIQILKDLYQRRPEGIDELKARMLSFLKQGYQHNLAFVNGFQCGVSDDDFDDSFSDD